LLKKRSSLLLILNASRWHQVSHGEAAPDSMPRRVVPRNEPRQPEEPVFRGRRDYSSFVDLLKETSAAWNVRVAAYCSLPNHYHCARKLDDEVPESRELAPDVDGIKRAVCEFYRVKEAELLVSRRGSFNEARNVAIHLTRRLRRDRLKGIGEAFQVKTYSSVGSVVERLKAALAVDRRLRQRVERLIGMIDKSQEQTPFRFLFL